MRRILILFIFGTGLAAAVIAICLSIGLFSEIGAFSGGSLSRAGLFLTLGLFVLGQVAAFISLRYRVALKVFVGVTIWQLAWWLFYLSPQALFWEPLNTDGSRSVSWRTDVAVLLLLALSLAVSSLAVRLAKSRARSSHPVT